MSIKAYFQPTDPDYINMTLTLTMTLGEWKRLKLDHDYPGWRIQNIIGDMVKQAEAGYEKKHEIEHP